MNRLIGYSAVDCFVRKSLAISSSMRARVFFVVFVLLSGCCCHFIQRMRTFLLLRDIRRKRFQWCGSKQNWVSMDVANEAKNTKKKKNILSFFPLLWFDSIVLCDLVLLYAKLNIVLVNEKRYWHSIFGISLNCQWQWKRPANRFPQRRRRGRGKNCYGSHRTSTPDARLKRYSRPPSSTTQNQKRKKPDEYKRNRLSIALSHMRW